MTLYVADDRDSICVLAGITSKALLTTTLTPTLYDMRMTTVSFTPSIRRQLWVANPHCCCRSPTLSQTSVCWHMHWHFLPININPIPINLHTSVSIYLSLYPVRWSLWLCRRRRRPSADVIRRLGDCRQTGTLTENRIMGTR